MSTPIKFACIGDLHYRSNGTCDKDPRDVALAITKSGAQFTIVPGDLTDGELGDKEGCFGRRPSLSPQEIYNFDAKFFRRVPSARLCPGNHDGDAARNYIRSKSPMNGSDLYYFDVGNTRFVCLGLYPDAAALKWLRDASVLTPPPRVTLNRDAPVPYAVTRSNLRTAVIYYHYNTIDAQQWSNWWTPAEKDAFAAQLNSPTNTLPVVLIINGHCHASYPPTLWKNKYRIAVVGGDYPALGSIDPVTGQLLSFTYIR